VRLVVNDFAAATTELRATKLISDSAEGKFISLADGVQTNQIVGQLVSRGMDVFVIAPEAQTLEDFYLSLMKQH
jgi:hypothetical protein